MRDHAATDSKDQAQASTTLLRARSTARSRDTAPERDGLAGTTHALDLPHGGRTIALQTKLTMGGPDDVHEREADRVADAVVNMPEARGQPAAAPAGEAVSGLVRAKSAGAPPAAATPVPTIVHDVLNSPGQPLDAATRAFMEPRFGRDFSGVRVHANAKAAEANDLIGARAFTANRHVAFGDGEYEPASARGRLLLAHELVHVVQQGPSDVIQRQQHEKTVTIIVKKGDDLFDLAVKYGTSPTHLLILNNLKTANIMAGQKLRVPQKHKAHPSGMGQKHDDTYGKFRRPHFGDYTITKADLDKTIAYTDPVSGASYACPVKETFYGIWVQHELARVLDATRMEGNDSMGKPRAFAPVILIPVGAGLFFSVDAWNKLDIAAKVHAFDNHPGWDLMSYLDGKTYPDLNAELERRIRLHRLDNSTTKTELNGTSVVEAYWPVVAAKTAFGNWFLNRDGKSWFGYRPIPPGPLKYLGDNEDAVVRWNKFTLQQKVDCYKLNSW